MVKRGSKKGAKSVGRDKVIRLLVENNVALQKVLINLSSDISGLTREVSKLLELFKEASKTIGEEKAVEDIIKEERTDLIPKLDELIDQNKTIAKGLVLLESVLREKEKPKGFSF